MPLITFTPSRLDFRMHDFLRMSWASEVARDVWLERFRSVVKMCAALEWLSVSAGVRRCCVLTCSVARATRETHVWRAHALHTLSLADLDSGPGQPTGTLVGSSRPVLVGRRSDIAAFEEAWRTLDRDAVARMLGVPACCNIASFRRSRDNSCHDPVWSIAADTVTPAGPSVDLAGTYSVNVLWRRLKMHLIPQWPCTFNCPSSQDLGDRYCQVARDGGYTLEIDWLRQILTWPAEWSALHGIAEMKTPVVKIVMNTDATREKLIIRWNGDSYPVEGIHGLVFPYQLSDKSARVREHHARVGRVISLKPT